MSASGGAAQIKRAGIYSVRVIRSINSMESSYQGTTSIKVSGSQSLEITAVDDLYFTIEMSAGDKVSATRTVERVSGNTGFEVFVSTTLILQINRIR